MTERLNDNCLFKYLSIRLRDSEGQGSDFLKSLNAWLLAEASYIKLINIRRMITGCTWEVSTKVCLNLKKMDLNLLSLLNSLMLHVRNLHSQLVCKNSLKTLCSIS